MKHGYNLTGAQYVHKNRQWQSESYTADVFDANGAYTLPAELIDGDVRISADFEERSYVAFNETEAMPEITAGEGNVKLTRKFVTGQYNTLVLPFALTQAQITSVFGDGTKTYYYAGDQNNVLYFYTMASNRNTQANVPFLIVTNAGEGTFTFGDITLETSSSPVATGNNYDFVGNYDGKITLAEGSYFIADNLFYRSVGKTTMKGYRGYFQAKMSGAKELTLALDDETTGITTLTTLPGEADTYNLQGQKVDAGHVGKGVYISGGQKRVVK